MDKKEDYTNYKKMFLICAMIEFADGLFYPFLIAFLFEKGGMPLIGSGFGMMMIAESFGTYFAGKMSDEHGRKPFLIASLIISVFVFLAFLLIAMIEIDRMIAFFVLIIILIVDGITSGMWGTVEAVYLSDITHITQRGKMMGTYWGVGGIIFGMAMIGAGFLGVYINFLTIAIIVACIYLVSIALLFKIKDTVKI
jgi:MFS family permease